MKSLKNNVVFLDAGHGGIDRNGVYVTAPSKQFHHSKGEFHHNGWFYEGVWNRHFNDEYLAPEIRKRGIQVVKIYHPIIDTWIPSRVRLYESIASLFDDFIVISTHANAFIDEKVEGFEVHIHPNAGRGSKRLASLMNKHMGSKCPWVKIRSTKSKTRWSIVSGNGTAALIENGYMTNFKEAMSLFDRSSCQERAVAQADAIEEYFNV